MNVDDALARVLPDFARLPAEIIALDDAYGRILASDASAANDLPPFANSSMDGYAVRAADVASASQAAPVSLRVTMDIPAGSAPQAAIGAGEAARIMTGAMLPAGADAVVPVEQTDADWRSGSPPSVGIWAAARVGSNVRDVGEDVRAGAVVLTAGTRLGAAALGVLAGLGMSQVPVVRLPRIAVLSGGDELLAPDEPLAPGKIRDMNGTTLAALVREQGGIALRLPRMRDTLASIRAVFAEALAMQPDAIVSSAGVSVGAADYIRTVLAELGEVGFWKISLRPGKPFAYGKLNGVPFFGLPGNPVSAMVTFDVFVRPALLRLTGVADDATMTEAIAAEDIPSDGRRSYVRVRLRREGGQLYATTTGTQSSGAITSMVMADGLLIIPDGQRLARAGEAFPVRLLR
jgi:molybdopterin molybdotransferase